MFTTVFWINVSVTFFFVQVLFSLILLLIDIPCLISLNHLWKKIFLEGDNRLLTACLWAQLEKPHEGYIFLAGAHMTSTLLSEIKGSLLCSSPASSHATTLTRTKCRGHSLISSILIGERKWCHSSVL